MNANFASSSSRSGRVTLLVGLGLWLILAVIWSVRLSGGPADQPNLSPAEGSPLLPCVSYAPFRRPGHTPFDPHLRLTREALRDDLSRLARISSCVRLYGVSHGLDQVPEIAGELGLKVALGAWISRDAAANEVELERVLELARRHPEVVRTVIVGNEVLLRRELTAQQLAGLLQRARTGSGGVPVTYADVWEFWLRDIEALKPHVDLIGIHVLPYWEDNPTGVGAAAAHMVDVVKHVEQAFAPLPVWVAETGWPVRGRQRGPALPGLMEQARWVADLQALHRDQGIDFNFIEGFDQPWKRQLEGVMGGAWGLLDAQGELRAGKLLRPALGDPEALAGLLGLTLGACIAMIWSRRKGLHLLNPTVMGMSLVVGLIAHHFTAWLDWPRSISEWVTGGVAPLLLVLVSARPYRKQLPNRTLDAMLLFALSVGALTLCFDARYRMLPWSLVAAAAVLAWWRLFHHSSRRVVSPLSVGSSPATRMMGVGLGVAAIALPLLEGPENIQAWGVAAGWAALSLSALWAIDEAQHAAHQQPQHAEIR